MSDSESSEDSEDYDIKEHLPKYWDANDGTVKTEYEYLPKSKTSPTFLDICGTYRWVFDGQLEDYPSDTERIGLEISVAEREDPSTPPSLEDVTGKIWYGTIHTIFKGFALMSKGTTFVGWRIKKVEPTEEGEISEDYNYVLVSEEEDDNGHPFLIFEWNADDARFHLLAKKDTGGKWAGCRGLRRADLGMELQQARLRL